jgi:uncharacterized protein (DUF983 family)
MEYYILKKYQEEKKKCSEVEQGFDRYEPITKMFVIVFLVIMFIGVALMIKAMLGSIQTQWCFVGVIICVIALFCVLIIDSMAQKKHMEQYVHSHKEKLKILDKVLSDEFQINTKEKLNSLISLYQEDVEKKKDEEKKRNGFILTIFSAMAGVLTISFENMGLIGIDFDSWLYVATILLIVVSVAGICIYIFTYFDGFKRKYELMIKDLKELSLIKY